MRLIVLLVLVVTTATLCHTQNATENRRPKFSVAESPFQGFLKSKWRSYLTNIIAEGVTKLALKLDQALEETNATSAQNIFFSPYSLYNTLAMTLLASRDRTYREITNLLGLDNGIDISRNSEVVHRLLSQTLEEYQEMLKSDEEIPICKSSISMFIQEDVPIRKSFSNIVRQIYKCGLTHVDFVNNYEESKKTMKNWLWTAVGARIEDFSSIIPQSTNIAIFSAMNFKSEWNHQFNIDATLRSPFHIESDEQVSVEMMTQYTVTPFVESKELGMKMIGLSYKGSEVMMYVILPDTIGMEALRRVKGSLSRTVIDQLIGKMTNRSHLVLLPKMDLLSSMSLKNTLVKLGLASLFDPATADLSPLTQGRRASRPTLVAKPGNDSFTEEDLESAYLDYISSKNLTSLGIDEARMENPKIAAENLLHIVRMSVDERGKNVDTSPALDPSLKTEVFTINRPFLFFVRHNPTRNIWLWGSIRRPTPFNSTSYNTQ